MELTRHINNNPKPANRPLSVTRIRGPYLSVSFPMTIPAIPLSSEANEKAPDMTALPELNSVASGFKKTPKVNVIIAFM